MENTNITSEDIDSLISSEDEGTNENESDKLNCELFLKEIEHSKYPHVKVHKIDVDEYNRTHSSFRITKGVQMVIDYIFLATHYTSYVNEKIDIQYLGSRKGYGVIAIDNIPAHEVVALYFGAVCFKKPRGKGDRILEVRDGKQVYWVDAKRDEETYSAFFNDNHISPNLEILFLKPSVSKYKYPYLVTSRKILQNEELTYRYAGDDEHYWWRSVKKKYTSLKYDLRKPKSLCSGKSLQKIFEYHVDNDISEDKSSFEIVDCNEKGMGLIARRHFPKDSFLMFYSGQEVDEKELVDDSYVYEIHLNNKRKWVNAFYSRCYSRYMNDNNESPNVYVKPMRHPRNGRTYIVFLAKADIKPGDQLEYDYGGGSKNYDWRKKPKLSENVQLTKISSADADIITSSKMHQVENEQNCNNSLRIFRSPRTQDQNYSCNGVDSMIVNNEHLENAQPDNNRLLENDKADNNKLMKIDKTVNNRLLENDKADNNKLMEIDKTVNNRLLENYKADNNKLMEIDKTVNNRLLENYKLNNNRLLENDKSDNNSLLENDKADNNRHIENDKLDNSKLLENEAVVDNVYEDSGVECSYSSLNCTNNSLNKEPLIEFLRSLPRNPHAKIKLSILSNFKEAVLRLQKLKMSNLFAKDLSFKTFMESLNLSHREHKTFDTENSLLELWKDCRIIFERYVKLQTMCETMAKSYKIEWLPELVVEKVDDYDTLCKCFDFVETAIKENNCKLNIPPYASYEQKINVLFKYAFKLVQDLENSSLDSADSCVVLENHIHEIADSPKETENCIPESTNSYREPGSFIQDTADTVKKPKNSQKVASLHQEQENSAQESISFPHEPYNTNQELSLSHEQTVQELRSLRKIKKPIRNGLKVKLSFQKPKKYIQETFCLLQEPKNLVQESPVSPSGLENSNQTSTLSPTVVERRIEDSKEKNLMKNNLQMKMEREQPQVLKSSQYLNTSNSKIRRSLNNKHDKQYDNYYEEIESWLDEKERELRSEENWKDLNSIQNGLKMHAQMDADIISYQDNIDSFKLISQMLKNSTTDVLNIISKQVILEERYNALREKASLRKKSLETSLQTYRLLRDIEEEEAWIQEREPLSRITSWGRDLTGVQTLIEKHQAIINDIKEHEFKITALNYAAIKNIFINEKIKPKLNSLKKNWENLKSNCQRRLSQLNYSHQVHQFLVSASNLETWLDEREARPNLRTLKDSRERGFILDTMDCQADVICLASSSKDFKSVHVCQGFVPTSGKENIENDSEFSVEFKNQDSVVIKEKLRILKNRFDKLMKRC